MRVGVVYTRPPDRRPVWLGPRLGLQDVQGQIPQGWCLLCGREVFGLEEDMCPKCAKEENLDVYRSAKDGSL